MNSELFLLALLLPICWPTWVAEFHGASAKTIDLPPVNIPPSILRNPEVGADISGNHIRLVRPMTSLTVAAGESATFICDIIGKPLPHYRWLKDGEDVAQRSRFNVRAVQFGSTLQIKRLRHSDAGQYSCVAANRNGTLSTDAQLIVTGSRRRRPDGDGDDDFGDEKADSDYEVGKRDGFCQQLRISVCSGYLRRGARVLVESQIYQQDKELQLMQLHKMMREVSNETCLPPLMEAVCRHSFPECAAAEDGTADVGHTGISTRRRRRQRVRQLCRQDCQKLTLGEPCRGSFNRLKDSLEYFDRHSASGAQLRHLLPSCDSLPSQTHLCEPLATQSSPGDHPDGCFVSVGSRTGRRCLPPESPCRPAASDVSDRRPGSPWCYVDPGGIETCRRFDLCGDRAGPVTNSRGFSSSAVLDKAPPRPSESPGDVGEGRPRSQPALAPIFGSLGGLAVLALLTLLAFLAGCRFYRRKRQRWTIRRFAGGRDGGKQTAAELTAGDCGGSMDIPLTQLRFGEELGDWCFGRAYRGELIGLHSASSLTPVAIRCLRAGADAATRRRFLAEFHAMAEVTTAGGHPNLVRLLGASLSQTPSCVVTELAAGRDLHELLVEARDNKNAATSAEEAYDCDATEPTSWRLLSQHQMLHAAAQVACALEYLADRGFVHRDVAARNVQVDAGFGHLHCRLGDLGQCRDAYSADYYRLQVSHGGGGGGGSSGSSGRLPIRWMPPEAILFGSYSPQSDAYSLGVLLWEIWSLGAQPYSGRSNSAAIDLIRARRLLACPAECPARLYGLMLGLWADPAAARLSAGNVREQLRLWHAEELAMLTPMQPQPPLTPAGASSSSASSACLMPPPPQKQQPPQPPMFSSGFSTFFPY